MTALDELVLRDRQVCPDWCEGGDHADVAEEIGEGSVPMHDSLVAEVNHWNVSIEQPVSREPGRGWPVLKLTHHWFDDDGEGYVQVVKMSSVEARSIAAMLIAAADREQIHRR